MPQENQNTQKNSKSSLVILILVVIVIIGVAGYSYFEKNNKGEAETTTLPTSESTSEEVTNPPQENTSVTSLGAVRNSSLWVYDVWEEDFGGFLGVIIDFEPVDNADGYVLRYVYDTLDSSSDASAQISRADTVLYFSSQVGPQRIDIRPYKEGGSREDILYGEWYTIFDDQDIDYNSAEELDYSEWNSLTMTSKEIYP